ncbi:MAG TPA: toprim domain-containing protein [Candidatus Paceibacterota bacterium]|nr:toprim domain-containing protein [Candidatus Paceibacterota bacterium]
MNAIDSLQEIIARLPGIGPRQARRIVFSIAQQGSDFRGRFIRELERLSDTTAECTLCRRQTLKADLHSDGACSICSDSTRDTSTRMIVSTSLDLEAIERTGAYRGVYYVFGPLVPLSPTSFQETSAENRINTLLNFLSRNNNVLLKEIVISFSATADGQHTSHVIAERIRNSQEQTLVSVPITVLGRGMSTGTEIEYIDEGTFAAAFKGRNPAE